MLENKVIVYDDSCPMCKLYTYWFVAWGFLKADNRIGFATISEDVRSKLDLDRGRHEIPLFDRETGQTLYGLEALTFVLGSRWTFLKPFFRTTAFYWMFYPLYQIITYNRRVMAGCTAACGFDCAPDLNRFYRSVYLIMVGVFVAATVLLLAATPPTITAAVIDTTNFGPALLIALTSVGGIVTAIKRVTESAVAAWDYAGNYATTTLIVAAFLLPTICIPAAAGLAGNTFFGAACLIGLSEMRRRRL